MKKTLSLLFILSIAFFLLSGLTDESHKPAAPFQKQNIRASVWPEANEQFRKDGRWLGGDDAYTIDLGNGRILWLFGDSFIATDDSRDRKKAELVRNSVAIQQGYNPVSAEIRFYWGNINGNPSSFFSDSGNEWYWPGHGIMLEGKLIVFLMRICQKNDFFDVSGWNAAMVENPAASPKNWIIKKLETPGSTFGITIGSATVMQQDGHIYAFSVDPLNDHPVFLVRWPIDEFTQGILKNPAWWTGKKGGWVRQSQLKSRPPPIFLGGQMEFSVHFDAQKKLFLQVQTKSFWDSDLTLRWSKNLTGPWSETISIYTPAESGIPEFAIYAGKAHPELAGADLIATYVVNTFDYDRLFEHDQIYYPVFLKINLNSKPSASP
jgi:hypothetical protein